MSAFSQGRGHERHLHGCQNHEGCRRRKHFVENSKEVLLCNLGFISRKSRKSKRIWEELFRTSRRSSSPPSLSLWLSVSSPRSHTHMRTHCPMELPPFDLSPLPLTHTCSHTNKHTVPRSCYPTANFRGSQTMSKTLFTSRVSAPSSVSIQALTCPQKRKGSDMPGASNCTCQFSSREREL